MKLTGRKLAEMHLECVRDTGMPMLTDEAIKSEYGEWEEGEQDAYDLLAKRLEELFSNALGEVRR
jgi:hypothetical protein